MQYGGPGVYVHLCRKTTAINARQQARMTAIMMKRRRGVSQDAAPAGCAGALRIARAISFRPRRSAIRMVPELLLLVERIKRVRSRGGTSSTERYTRSSPPAEIRTVD